jgi:hypothetical protein
MDFVTLTGLPTLSGRRATNLSGCEAAERVGVQHAQNLPVKNLDAFAMSFFIRRCVIQKFYVPLRK